MDKKDDLLPISLILAETLSHPESPIYDAVKVVNEFTGITINQFKSALNILYKGIDKNGWEEMEEELMATGIGESRVKSIMAECVFLYSKERIIDSYDELVMKEIKEEGKKYRFVLFLHGRDIRRSNDESKIKEYFDLGQCVLCLDAAEREKQEKQNV